MKLTRGLGSILTLLAVAASLPASAQIALTFTGGTTSSTSVTRGWEFTTSGTATIGALGWWDQGNDGLANSHQVGIWNTSGVLLVSATVASGTTDQLVSGFRFDSSLTGSPTLPAGTYVIGGLSTSADLVASAVPSGNVTLLPGITYITNESGTGSFAFPTAAIPGADDGTFGPNFYVGSLPPQTVTPEPGAIGLFLGSTVSGGLFLLRRRRRK